MQIFSGNAYELGDIGMGPRKSYLFSLTVCNPGNELFGDRGLMIGRASHLCGV
ncbi:uncharacterized protein MELLADRAFT_84550 [Melampsora larici-populina 98AG31]|uniref:Uncharacterized protein n=1 Tax=Melampsora larici-populina (strain 98AG31 / pathotype 3-4-7) TaxID=747676 RepID=F4SCF2_MELLP|nr:uncharacterized protein MELLADRAFT_84550 [Melampsora larici-populina 98AG31]EGF97686.1 hypothetical protein MELLADRAFT_84550 [Melampsora larici-populina 98AG31]